VPPPSRVALPGIRLTDSYDQQIDQLQNQYNGLGTQLQSLQGSEATANAQAARAAADRRHRSPGSVGSDADQPAHLALAQTARRSRSTPPTSRRRSATHPAHRGDLTQGGTGVVEGWSTARASRLHGAAGLGHHGEPEGPDADGPGGAEQQALDALQQTAAVPPRPGRSGREPARGRSAALQGQESELKQQGPPSAARPQAGEQRNSLLSQIATVRAQQQAALRRLLRRRLRRLRLLLRRLRRLPLRAAEAPACAALCSVLCLRSIPNSFPWGQCTWYVASLREVRGAATRTRGSATPRPWATRPARLQAGGHRGVGPGQWLQLLRTRRLRGGRREPTNFYVNRGQLRRDFREHRLPRGDTLNDVEGFIY